MALVVLGGDRARANGAETGTGWPEERGERGGAAGRESGPVGAEGNACPRERAIRLPRACSGADRRRAAQMAMVSGVGGEALDAVAAKRGHGGRDVRCEVRLRLACTSARVGVRVYAKQAGR